MAKFPSQRKMVYDVSDISATTMASEGYLNLPKDLSILNRRGYASTTRKGVPLVYQVKVDWYLHDDLGTGPATAYGADLQATMKLVGCQNNWVMKNAAVKWHAAREEMFKAAGVRKSQRGAYSHEIRYNFDSNGQTWMSPIDGDGNALTGGTWDVSDISTEDDTTFELKLVGSASTEDSDFAATAQPIGYSYLVSRTNLRDDTNEETNVGLNSVLQDLLSPMDNVLVRDDVLAEAETAQDNVPYDVFTPSDLDHDITESVELGRAVAGFGNAYGSTIMEIPFGLANLRAQVHDAAGTDVTTNGLICVEVLDIYEMQG